MRVAAKMWTVLFVLHGQDDDRLGMITFAADAQPVRTGPRSPVGRPSFGDQVGDRARSLMPIRSTIL